MYFSFVIITLSQNMFFEKYFKILKIGHFKMSIFEKARGLLFFHFFRKHDFSFCEHYANNTEIVNSCYAVEEIGRDYS